MDRILKNGGYEMKTTFWEDFTIADLFGTTAIQETFDRSFNDWKTDTEYITEFTMVLNWKIWQHYEKQNHVLCELYDKLWRQMDEWCMNNLKGKDLKYYITTTD